MSSVTSPNTGNTDKPNEGARQDDLIEVDRPVNVDITSDGSEDGEIEDSPPIGTKRSHSPSVEEQPSPKRNKLDSQRSGVSFKDMRHPHERLACVISVDQQEPIGKLYRAKKGFMIKLFMDPGRYGPPAITLGFSIDGKKESASNKWDTSSCDEGSFAMSDIEYGFAPIIGSDPIMSDPKVTNLCDLADGGKLMYLRFASWDQPKGFLVKGAFKNESQAIQRSLNSIFLPTKERYEVVLWFVAPFWMPVFMKYCLWFFKDSERNRVHPLDGWKDSDGTYFNDTLSLKPPKALTYEGSNKTMYRQRVHWEQTGSSKTTVT